MIQKETQEIHSEVLNLNQLDLDLKVETDVYITFEGSPSGLIQRLEGLPEGFDVERDVEGLYKPAHLVVDGFTPRANKNILSIDGQELKIFSVTENDIKLLSCSSLFLRVEPSNIEHITMIFNLHSSSLILYFGLSSFPPRIIKLNGEKGKLKKVENLDLQRVNRFSAHCQSAKFSLKSLQSLQRQPIIGFLTEPGGYYDLESSVYLFSLHKRGMRPWMALSIGGDPGERYRKTILQGKKFKRQMSFDSFSDSSEETVSWETRIFPFSRIFSLVIISNPQIMLLKLVEIKTKKVVKSRYVSMTENVLIKAYLKNFKKLRKNEKEEAIESARYLLKDSTIFTAEVCGETRRLILEMRSPWNSFLVSYRLDSLFSSLAKGLVIEKKVKPINEKFFMKALQGENVLALRRAEGENQRKDLNLVRVDPRNLEEEDFCQLEQPRDHEQVLFSEGFLKHALPTKISKDLLLLVCPSNFTIFNSKLRKPSYKFSHFPQMKYSLNAKITNIANYTFWTSTDSLFVVKRFKERKDTVGSFRKVNLLDHIPRVKGRQLGKEYSLFKLESGNLLYIGARYDRYETFKFKHLLRGRILTRFSLEICPKTFKVLRTWIQGKEDPEYTDKMINLKDFYLVDGDLFVSVVGKKKQKKKQKKKKIGVFEEQPQKSGSDFQQDESGEVDWSSIVKDIGEKETTNNQNYDEDEKFFEKYFDMFFDDDEDEEEGKITYGLALWDKELNLLDTNFGFDLLDLKSIRTVDRQFVTARGFKNNFVLFEIDIEQDKIIPKKNLLLMVHSIKSVDKQEEYPKEFKCRVSGVEVGIDLLLRFDSQLHLLTWTANYKEEYVFR